MTLLQITRPTAEPITVEEVKEHLLIDYDDQDDLIERYIKAARAKLERRCGRVFMEQTWELREAEFEKQVDIPLAPVQSLTSVTYLDEDGDTQTVSTGDYDLLEGGGGASSVLFLEEFPTVYDRPDALRIRFVAGYADLAESPTVAGSGVPDEIKQAILWLTGHFFENRESVILQPTRQELMELPDSVAAIIAPFIVPRL